MKINLLTYNLAMLPFKTRMSASRARAAAFLEVILEKSPYHILCLQEVFIPVEDILIYEYGRNEITLVFFLHALRKEFCDVVLGSTFKPGYKEAQSSDCYNGNYRRIV